SYDISVRKIDFIDDQTGWAVGGRNDVGYIFKTTSAGYVWLPQVIDSTVSSISGIEMLDSLNGWAVGKNKVYQT
ncbi:MAG: hypothetical protein GWN62_00170, partial [Aliifodinibius sp.]|nr:hypothetical protein [Fodinibius sp.]